MNRREFERALCAISGIGAGLFLLGRPARAADEQPRVRVSQLLGRPVPLGLLGKPLGSRAVVEGTRAEGVLLENALWVTAVDGQPLPQPANLELRGKVRLAAGTRYKLEGYESGAFAGEPEWLNSRMQQSFQYRPSYVVTRVVQPAK
jgi:hypothetical protein